MPETLQGGRKGLDCTEGEGISLPVRSSQDPRRPDARSMDEAIALMGLRLAVSLALLPLATLAAQQPATPRPDARAAFAGFEAVPLTSGANRIDLDGDGTPDVVFKAWRDNANAHGFEVITFYLADPDSAGHWLVVPLFDSTGGREQDAYRTFGGADCDLEDLLVVRSRTDARAPAQLVSGTREFGESFADSMPVSFVVYQFVADRSQIPGRPPYYFRAVRTIRGRGRYCDIHDAFEKELGLGHYAGPR